MNSEELKQVMRMRNILHGAPMGERKVAIYLRGFDEFINKNMSPERRIHKDNAYYEQVARTLWSSKFLPRVRSDGRD